MPFPPAAEALHRFSPPTQGWFRDAFEAPTRAQELGWDAIATGEHTLLLAPTGSGKTLAAFLWCLDELAARALPPSPKGKRAKRAGVAVLYVSPLKALTYDVERNLRAPLAGLRIAAQRAGADATEITIAVRTGDTPSRERQDIVRDPPDILITTPESLYLMLTSRGREVLRTVETVIVDEIHTMAGTKRGAHLSLSLERLEELTAHPPQRIGLSATQRPLDEVARYLAGSRPVRVVDAGATKQLELRVSVPVEDMTRPADSIPPDALAGSPGAGPEERTSVWPAIYPRILQEIRAHRSTLIFVNNRRLAERLAARLNELAGEELVRAHHGSVSREQRTGIEESLKAGLLPALACTSSMELGIDMGAVDLVIQVESPKSVARGLQRIGRAGHQVGAPSSGLILPKFRGDLLECAVLTGRMRAGQIEATKILRNPLDVLAQQIVAMCAVDDWTVDALFETVRRSYNFASLGRDSFEAVLGMLAGQYPSDEFAELKPRITWDRTEGVLRTRGDAKTVAVVNAGTIPDRGLYGVFLGEGGPRVGELDEEMVYESRPGETFVLGATTWRIEQITRDRVIVSPAPGHPGKMPFWKGDGIGRPIEFGRAIGAFTREIAGLEAQAAERKLQAEHDLDALAARNLVAYLQEEREATGVLPTDRTIVVERYRDELGDWRIVILTPFGGQVHAPWAQAIEARLAEESGFDVQTLWSDDGIALRFADTGELPAEDLLFPDPETVEDAVVGQLGHSSLFAGRFRENAGRALLLPRRRPGARSPLWAQRQRAANLLAVASRYGSFPIVLETYRECLADVFDLPGLKEVLTAVRSRDIRVVSVETREASPFARSLLFDYVAAYMYEGDAPLAERRAQALALDRGLLQELLGEEELRELLHPDALDITELELQGLTDSRRARNPDQLHDLLRRVGDLSPSDLAARCAGDGLAWANQLEAGRRACLVRIAGEPRWIAIEDAGRYRDALGVSPPLGVPEVFLKPGPDPLGGLVARYARTHAPFVASSPAERWAIPVRVIERALDALAERGIVVHGAFRPGGMDREWCDAEVLRMLRRRSLARLRKEVEPVPVEALARFLPAWQGVGSQATGIDRLREVVAQIEGLPLPASVLEREILPARVRDYRPQLLDELGAAGEVVWVGRGASGRGDGKVALYRREQLPRLAPRPVAYNGSDLHDLILAALRGRGALFFADIAGAANAQPREALDALWDLAWAGLVTNDTFAPVRATGWRQTSAGGPRRGGLVPPEAAGRWSLTGITDDVTASSTVRAHATASMLLERYGVLAREAVNAEGIAGGFAGLYPVLRAMEESGRARRGYFVETLGGAQFALAGAADRLRAARDENTDPVVLVLAATDPANPYGAAIPWPRREDDTRRQLARAAGARVVLVDGHPVVYVERNGHALVTLAGAARDGWVTRALAALAEHEAPSRRGFTVERVDGEPVDRTALAPLLRDLGFEPGYKGYTYRKAPRAAAHA